jgi:hypothetical protein
MNRIITFIAGCTWIYILLFSAGTFLALSRGTIVLVGRQSNSISMRPQPVEMQITIERVSVDHADGAYIVIQVGGPIPFSRILGVSPITPKGTQTNIVIPIDTSRTPVKSGDIVSATLYGRQSDSESLYGLDIDQRLPLQTSTGHIASAFFVVP